MKKLLLIFTLVLFGVQITIANEYFSCNNGALTISYSDQDDRYSVITIHDDGVVNYFRDEVWISTTYQYGRTVILVDETYNNVSFYILKPYAKYFNGIPYFNKMKGYQIYGEIRDGGFYLSVDETIHLHPRSVNWFFESCDYL